MTSKSMRAGLAGNVARDNVPLRQWSARSYSANDGRSASSLADQRNVGSPSTTHANPCSAQIPDAFKGIDARRTQNPTPVVKRPLG
jgi:hypothetical protein